MGKYVLAFRGQPDRTAAPEEEQAWGAWFGQLGPAIADMGNRVGATRTLPAARRGSKPPSHQTLNTCTAPRARDLGALGGTRNLQPADPGGSPPRTVGNDTHRSV